MAESKKAISSRQEAQFTPQSWMTRTFPRAWEVLTVFRSRVTAEKKGTGRPTRSSPANAFFSEYSTGLRAAQPQAQRSRAPPATADRRSRTAAVPREPALFGEKLVDEIEVLLLDGRLIPLVPVADGAVLGHEDGQGGG